MSVRRPLKGRPLKQNLCVTYSIDYFYIAFKTISCWYRVPSKFNTSRYYRFLQRFRPQLLHQPVRLAEHQHDPVATFQLRAAAHVLHRVHVLRDEQYVSQVDRNFGDGNRSCVLRVWPGRGKKKKKKPNYNNIFYISYLFILSVLHLPFADAFYKSGMCVWTSAGDEPLG